jgi:hypothetical protein
MTFELGKQIEINSKYVSGFMSFKSGHEAVAIACQISNIKSPILSVLGRLIDKTSDIGSKFQHYA